MSKILFSPNREFVPDVFNVFFLEGQMKVLKRVNKEVEITKPILDLAFENDVELYFREDEDVLTIFAKNDDNAFIE